MSKVRSVRVRISKNNNDNNNENKKKHWTRVTHAKSPIALNLFFRLKNWVMIPSLGNDVYTLKMLEIKS